MARNLNSCSFIGRLGKDPEIKNMSNGNAVANFGIAVGDDYKDKQGQKVEQTNWVNVVIFGKLAEICGQYLTKGSQVYINGKFVTRKWQDKEGNDKYSTEIVANEMEMLGGKQDDGAKAAQPDKYPSHQPQPANNQPVDDVFDQEIPF